jgi:hypothetical protein
MQIITYLEEQLVKRHSGTMPIILTSPHGGSEAPPNVSERTKEDTPANCDFQNKRDDDTATITERMAQKIVDLTGLSPYVVIARFHRKYIDANRSAPCAFTDADARPFYDEYHNRVKEFINQLLAQNGNRGFLFDIHGTLEIASDPADLYLGTADGLSFQPGFDRSTVFMQHGLHGLLKSVRRQSGMADPGQIFQYRVSPLDETTTETSAVSGGFTIREYGPLINAIQIEIANTIRDDSQKADFLVEDLALAMINFVRRHSQF